MKINQIDVLKERYPDNVIGFSTHEYHNWNDSMLLSYAKGARTWERHIDIDKGDYPVSKYCSLPHQVDDWFKAFRKAEEMCGPDTEDARVITEKEAKYIVSVSRGVYAKRDLPKGHTLKEENLDKDFYLAIPAPENGYTENDFYQDIVLTEAVSKDEPIIRD